MSEKLKPCPFCGGESELVEEKHGKYSSLYFVACKGMCIRQYHYKDKNRAIKAWNRRANGETV